MGRSRRHELSEQPDTGTALKEKESLKTPNLYRVLMMNDDFTPMDFVIGLLESVFHKPHEEAVSIMQIIHNEGMGLCGVFTYEVAEAKVSQCTRLARRLQHPLQCVMDRL